MNLDLSSITPDRRAEYLADYERAQRQRAAERAAEQMQEARERNDPVNLVCQTWTEDEIRANTRRAAENAVIKASPAYQRQLMLAADRDQERCYEVGLLVGRAQSAERLQRIAARCSEWAEAARHEQERQRWMEQAAELLRRWEAGDESWRKLRAARSVPDAKPWRTNKWTAALNPPVETPAPVPKETRAQFEARLRAEEKARLRAREEKAR